MDHSFSWDYYRGNTMNQYQTNHLLLLVGSNPLPNAVAGILLTTPESAISLLHSPRSFDVAQRLQNWLKMKGRREPRLREIDESDPASIFSGVRTELQSVGVSQIGLNYTGGTKAMSVHSYRAIEKYAQQKRSQGKEFDTTFSYLNPRKLELVIDPADPQSGESPRRLPAELEPKLTLTDLLDLHAWSLKHDPNSDPILPESAGTLAKACAQNESFDEWRTWIHDKVRTQCRDDKGRWYGKSKLPESLDPPSNPAVISALQRELPFSETALVLKQSIFDNDAKHFCEWLDGKWLEHHVLDELRLISPQLNLHQLAQNVETHEVQFDVDVVALRGYQLFAISCSTDAGKGLLKSKLFEAYIRARQLGGDEARTALVCCSSKPEEIEQEMRRDVDPEGRIRVFGQSHLPDIRTHLINWIREQSKGV
jgi:Card1-like endonuclease family protein